MQQIYDGLLEFNEHRHAYHWNGSLLPGVTSIMRRVGKPALITWAANLAADTVLAGWHPDITRNEMFDLCEDARRAHNTVKNEAAGIGKNIHAYAEARLRGEPTPELQSEEAKRGAEAFEDWLQQHDVRPLMVERRVMSKQYWYAGTTDIFGYIDGELCVADFKTGKGVYLDYWLQTAAYQIALEEELGKQVAARWIIRLDKTTGAVDPVRRPHSDMECEAFLELKRFDERMRRLEDEESDGISQTRRRRSAA